MKKKTKKRELTGLQKRFVDILHSMDSPSKLKAFNLAGYKSAGKVGQEEAHKTLNLPQVKAYYESLRQGATERAEKSADDIIEELTKVAFSSIKDYINVDDEGEIHFIPFDQVDDNKLAAVESIKVRVNVTRNLKEDREFTTTTQEFKLCSKLNALEQLGKHLGIYDKDNQQRTPKEVFNLLVMIDGSSKGKLPTKQEVKEAGK